MGHFALTHLEHSTSLHSYLCWVGMKQELEDDAQAHFYPLSIQLGSQDGEPRKLLRQSDQCIDKAMPQVPLADLQSMIIHNAAISHNMTSQINL